MRIVTKKWKNISLAAILLTAIILIFEIIPRFISVFVSVVEIIEQDDKISDSENADMEIKLLALENKKLAQGINRLVSDYEENSKMSSVISLIDSLALLNSMRISSIIPQKIMKTGNLWKQPIEININGSYENFFNFVRYLESSQKVIVIDKINIKSERIHSKELDIQLSLDAYLNL